MPMPKTLAAYRDVETVLNSAAANGGCIYTLSAPGKATHWVQRANTFRKLLRENGTPRFEEFTIYTRGEQIIVELRRVSGSLTDLEGNIIDPEETEEYLDPDLLSEAKRFVDKLGESDE